LGDLDHPLVTAGKRRAVGPFMRDNELLSQRLEDVGVWATAESAAPPNTQRKTKKALFDNLTIVIISKW
jgi:hypothetical protein